ncbi:MAG: PAS domain S-box protein [Calditrichaeota bacterium]|nr:PAS domain S-box protein [Calditrichota bacterium]MCB9368905.1 PAS domain S-box protein [Calditrichota bacterium]
MSDMRELEDRLAELEDELTSLRAINAALMSRVERSTDSAGSSFSLFESNILLQQRVQEHTKDLQKSNEKLQEEITEHKRTENELRRTQKQTRQIIDTALDAVIAFDRSWNILDWNHRAEETFGYSATTALDGLTLSSLIAPGGHDKLSHYLTSRDTEHTQTRRTLELTARHRDSHEFPVEIAVSLLHAGETPVFSAFIRDITERKLAEEARYKTLFENSPVALREMDFAGVKTYVDKLASRGIHDLREYFQQFPEAVEHCLTLVRVIDVNLATAKLLRAESKQQVHDSFGDLFRGDYVKTFVDELVSLASGKANFEMESQMSSLDGQTIFVAISVSIAPGHLNTWSKVFVSMLDISDRIRAEQEKSKLEAQIRQNQKMETIGTLAGGIAHDFNNMLSPILGYADIIADAPDDTDSVQEAIRNVVAAALRARDLVRQILTFSRQVEHEMKPIRPAPLVKEVLDLLRASLPTTVALSSKVDYQSNVIMADPTQIHQVILNLCTNAFQSLENASGTIQVRLQNITLTNEPENNTDNLHPGDYVCLTVSDTGCGIDQANIERIFEPFYTTKEVGSGTGMGLSVTHGIVQKHGGKISVDSVRGVGTSFHVYLPSIVQRDANTEDHLSRPLHGNERVLVIDDEELVAKTTGKQLERLGYKVTIVTTPSEALKQIRTAPESFDVVVTDQTMPEIPGHMLAKEISQIRPDLPILLLTGYSQVTVVEEIHSCGIHQVLMKPVSSADLSTAIRRALATKQEK